MTIYDDDPVLAVEAELIHAFSTRGIPLPVADTMELWELAASVGVHRVETREEHDNREIVEKKEQEWEETKTKRAAIMARRKERQAEKERR